MTTGQNSDRKKEIEKNSAALTSLTFIKKMFDKMKKKKPQGKPKV